MHIYETFVDDLPFRIGIEIRRSKKDAFEERSFLRRHWLQANVKLENKKSNQYYTPLELPFLPAFSEDIRAPHPSQIAEKTDITQTSN